VPRRSRRNARPEGRSLAVLGVALGAFALLLAVVLLLRVAPDPGGSVREHSTLPDKPMVVYHADFSDPRRMDALLASARRLADAYQRDQQEYDLRIVFVASAIRFLTDDPLPHTNFAEDRTLREWRPELRARLRALHADHGVKLELCNVTRESIGLEEARLYAGVELVPVGEGRIAELQGRGYRYLKVE